MKNVRELGSVIAAKGKELAGVAITGGALVAGSAMAAEGDIDVTSVVATITSGLAGVALIGAAWMGFKYLKKVWNRM